jgi:hypothetical protein
MDGPLTLALSRMKVIPHRITLTIPANFMLIAKPDKHPCMQAAG